MRKAGSVPRKKEVKLSGQKYKDLKIKIMGTESITPSEPILDKHLETVFKKHAF